MKSNSATNFLLIFLMIVVGLPSCKKKNKPSSEPSPIDITTTFVVDQYGREFICDVLHITCPDSVVQDVLQIHGDNIYISFGGSSGPYIPSINGPIINFAGHAFEILSTPNVYHVDGNLHSLPAHGKYVFYDGDFIRRE